MASAEDDPALFAALVEALTSRSTQEAFERFQSKLIAASNTVRSGPFTGMRLLDTTSWGNVASYLLGSYEQELHPALEILLMRGYETVIDVGCAEGYYAVGLARRLPGAAVHAFDIDEAAQRLCAELAVLNGVADRVAVAGVCDAGQLERLIHGCTLVFVDCEGCEAQLLDPTLAPALATADLIVELHDFVDPTITERVLDQLDSTHRIELVDVTSRSAADYPELAGEPGTVAFRALFEGRPTDPHPMQWAVMRSRQDFDDRASPAFPPVQRRTWGRMTRWRRD